MLRRGILTIALLALPAIGAAQDEPPQDAAPNPELAREHYQRGLQAIEDGRWADALEAFQESFRAAPTLPALFNQAVALRALGRMREARDTFARILQDYPDAEELARLSADMMGREANMRIARLEVGGLPEPDPELQLRLDGAPIEDSGERPLVLEVDPGEHTLAVNAPGYELFEWLSDVDDGERVFVRVRLESEGIPIWPFIAGGVGLAIAGAIVGYVLLTQQSDQTVINGAPERVP